MAVLPITNLTLADLAKRSDPDGKSIAAIVEMLSQQNEILQDASFIEGNLLTGHRTTIRTGLPTPTWTRINKVVQPSKSTTAQITFNTGMLEGFSEIDAKLVELGGPMARFTEDTAFIQAMNQELSTTMFYGNEKIDDAKFTGLAPYYSSLSAESGDNIISAGATDASTQQVGSIWLVGWSPTRTTGIIPKGSAAGLQVTDMGLRIAENVGGQTGRLRVWTTHFGLSAGLAVQDWRYNVRIANIARTLTVPNGATGPNLPNLMFSALERMEDLNTVTPIFYMDRYLFERFRQQLAAATASSTLTFENVGGVRTAMWQGFPIRRVDSLRVNESLITA
jgi:hypothetical protein